LYLACHRLLRQIGATLVERKARLLVERGRFLADRGAARSDLDALVRAASRSPVSRSS
jgi:hypothetical protein